MSSSIYYINGKQQYNSDVSFNNTNTQINSSQSVLINSNAIQLNGFTTINGSAPITLNTDNVWTGKNYFPVDASFVNLFISNSANSSITNDKLLTINSSNKVVFVDLSASSSNGTSLGGHSMMNNKTAWGSTAIGYDAMKNISSRTDISYANTAVGTGAMAGGNPTFGFIGWNNTAVGNNALSNVTTGGSNVAVGSQTLKTVTSGTFNTVVGCSSDVIDNSVTYNQIIGYNNTTGYSNVNIIGSNINATGTGRTFISNVRDTSGIAAINLTVYDSSTKEVSYCSDIIQKRLNNDQFISQQGVKLSAIDSLGQSKQGISISATADGNTMVVGGTDDNGGMGAVWVWTKNGNTWSRSQKLVATDTTTQGISVSISSIDGNTIAVGASGDNNGVGAVLIWTRQNASSPYNYQQKIIGTGTVGTNPAAMGTSVALSSNGNTVIFGGPGDNTSRGAAWIWTRSALGQNYTQSMRITGNDSTANSYFGSSIAISNDGNTIAVGGYKDNNFTGATWIFYNGFSGWAQQGLKLVGTSNSQSAMTQGYSVAISSDGNTLAVGGTADNNSVGAVWVFTRSGAVWSQVNNKLLGSNYVGSSIFQGNSVSMTLDGNTIAFGGYYDNVGTGAVWIFTRNFFGDSYTQQGQKIVGAGNISIGGINSNQGSSVFLSNDGSSLFVGGYGDNNNAGAVWVFPKTANNIYIGNNNASSIIGTTTPTSQLILPVTQSQNVVAYDNIGNSQQGYSIAITLDGNTMAVGSPNDNNGRGAVWIWLKYGQVWSRFQKITGFTGSYFGCSVAFSGSIDGGNTLAVGGYGDNGSVGAVWVYTRTAFMTNYAIQTNTKIVPSDLTGSSNQVGYSVALSSNGNKLAIGAPGDNTNRGSTWIWTRTGTTWSQQGLRLYGTTSSVTPSNQGTSVAMSADGNTLVIGGPGDDNGNGAVWVYSWSGSAWSLIQTKLIDNMNNAASNQGYSVAISTDGNTILYGSPSDNYGIGSVTVWSRSGTFSKIQKIVGTNNTGLSNQGKTVAISGDGLTAIVGGNYDNNNIGAVWVWNRYASGNQFYQYGPKIVGTGNVGTSQQGYSVAITSDGSSMLIGGYSDNATSGQLGIGAVWVFNKNSANISITNNNQFMGIGTVTPTAPLTVSCNNYNGGIATNSSCVDIYNYNIGGAFQRYFSNNQSNAWWHIGSEVGDGGKNFPFHIFNHNGTGLYVNSGDQSWSGYSDRRLKTNITDIDISGAYQNLLKLNPVTYKLLTDATNSPLKQGLIAQDVLSIFPQIVSMNHGLYGIGYTELIPYLIAGMKQQDTIITQQKEKIAAFEERLAALEAKLN